MLSVSWENNDFSFNSDGYLVNPSMIIITLDRERQWDKVSPPLLLTPQVIQRERERIHIENKWSESASERERERETHIESEHSEVD